MKKQIVQTSKPAVPAFASESEESQWWFENRDKHGRQTLAALKRGEAQVLTKEKLRQRVVASKKTPQGKAQGEVMESEPTS